MQATRNTVHFPSKLYSRTPPTSHTILQFICHVTLFIQNPECYQALNAHTYGSLNPHQIHTRYATDTAFSPTSLYVIGRSNELLHRVNPPIIAACSRERSVRASGVPMYLFAHVFPCTTAEREHILKTLTRYATISGPIQNSQVAVYDCREYARMANSSSWQW